MFAYPNTDFYANVKVEILPAEHYGEEKQLAVDGFDYTLASSSETTRNYALRPTLNDFSVQGLDRSKLEGGTLGIYLLFDDKARMLTTIYFLNADPERRKFSNMTDYAKLRDHFLSGYTSCIRRAQQTTTP
jgi:hypothetical protein